MIGQTINERYHIEVLLERGGMGAVYRATDLVENRPVALKFLHFFLDSETQVAQTRFHREFRVLARLDHPRIVRAYEYGTYEGIPYLVLEFLAGHTLTKEIAAGPLSRSRLLQIARQICEGLIYLHEQSIVHRDLKPGNLMLLPPDEAPQVKLMDFGLVRQNNLSQQLTQEGAALGTVAYMAPEQAQALPIDFRADLYALGIVLYEMATGRPPFIHDNPAMLLMQQLTSSLPSPRQFNPDLDEPLEQLILDLLAKEPAHRPASTEVVASRLADLADERSPVPSPPTNRADLIPRVPLIGREAALNQLKQHWARVETGQGQVIILSGLAGVGKTRLLNEVSLQAQISSNRVLIGYCREHASLPYQPLIDVLDKLLQDMPTAIRNRLPFELARLLPGAATDTPDDQGTTGQAETRLRLFAACWDLLYQGAQTHSLMVVIEAAHWADPTTLEMLDYLAHRIKQAPILFIVTYQPEWVKAGTPLATLERELQHSQVSQTVALDPLTGDQVEDFLRAALGQMRIPTWLADSFHQATGGNPLFIEETLKTLAAEGQVAEWVRLESSQWTVLSGQALQLPQTVLALAERRLQLLSAADHPILTAAAVLGPEFTFNLLEGVTQLDEDSLLDAIDRLLATHLIEELPLQAGEDRYRFAQESLRQALINSISQRRRRRLHRRVSESLEAIYGTGQPHYWPALAYHWRQAENMAKAVDYLQKAGEQARRSYAYQEAIAFFNEAIALLETLPETPERVQQEFTLQIALADALMVIKGWGGADIERSHLRALELSRQTGGTSERATVLLRLSRLYFAQGNQQMARALAEELKQLIRHIKDPELSLAAHYMMALIFFFTAELASAKEHQEQVFTLYDPQQHRAYVRLYSFDAKTAFLDYAHLTLWLQGYPQQARKMSHQGISLAQELEHPNSIVHAMAHLSVFYHFCREAQNVLKWAGIAIEFATEQEIPVYLTYATIVQGWALAAQGQVEEGVAQIQAGLTSWEPMGSYLWRPYFLALLADVYRKVGQVEAGLATVAEALELTAKTEERFWLAELYRLKGEMLLQTGARAAAEKSFDQALEVARSQFAKSLELRAATSLSRLWRTQGRTKEARQLLARVYTWFTEGFDTVDLKEAKALLDALPEE